VQRATLAKAVLVMQSDGKVLLRRQPSGRLELPHRELDAWIPVGTQLDIWLAELPSATSAPSLVSVEGTPGVEGVTFLYTATFGAAPHFQSPDLWLDCEAAKVALSGSDRRFLSLCASPASQS